jgi:hypothetical protein
MSGKTTLATKLAATHKNKGRGVLVLDPLLDPAWGADFCTFDPDLYIDTVYKSRSCALFVDESGETIGRYGGVMETLATRSRHFGHKAHFLCQRATQISKTMRAQCSEAYIFNLCLDDGIDLAREFNAPILREVHTLKQGECIYIRRFSAPVRLNAFSL